MTICATVGFSMFLFKDCKHGGFLSLSNGNAFNFYASPPKGSAATCTQLRAGKSPVKKL